MVGVPKTCILPAVGFSKPGGKEAKLEGCVCVVIAYPDPLSDWSDLLSVYDICMYIIYY